MDVEGFGISLVEASACGLPVVAGNSGASPTRYATARRVFLCRRRIPAALADAVCRVLADRGLAAQLGQNGRRAVETHFNWDRVVRDLRAIESEVVS